MEQILNIIKEVLKKDTIDLNDNFFDIGGGSIKALILVNEIEKAYNISLMVTEVYEQKYIGNIISLIESRKKISLKEKSSNTLYFNSFNRNKGIFFFIPPVVGTSIIYNKIATGISHNFNTIGLEYPGFHNKNEMVDTFQEMIFSLFQEIKKIQSDGDFFILGYSMGGLIGFEIAKILEKDLNNKVNLVLIDSAPQSMFYSNKEINTKDVLLEIVTAYKDILPSNQLENYQEFLLNNISLVKDYSASGSIKGNIISFEAKSGNYNMSNWANYTTGYFKNEIIDGDHFEVIKNIGTLSNYFTL